MTLLQVLILWLVTKSSKNMAKESYKFMIFGNEYSLVSDEDKMRVERAAQTVDALMIELAKRSGLTDQKKIAVLAALQLASKVVDLELSIDSFNKQEHALIERVDEFLSANNDTTCTL